MSTSETPAHRSAAQLRSGDTHVIGKNGKARNVDAEAREADAPATKPESGSSATAAETDGTPKTEKPAA